MGLALIGLTICDSSISVMRLMFKEPYVFYFHVLMKKDNLFVFFKLVYSSGWLPLVICFLILSSHYSLMNDFIHEKNWLPVMYFCFIGAILSKVCKTKFSNTSYNIFSRIGIGYETFREFLIMKMFIVTILEYLQLLFFEACF